MRPLPREHPLCPERPLPHVLGLPVDHRRREGHLPRQFGERRGQHKVRGDIRGDRMTLGWRGWRGWGRHDQLHSWMRKWRGSVVDLRLGARRLFALGGVAFALGDDDVDDIEPGGVNLQSNLRWDLS